MFEKADAELAQAEVFSSIWRAKRPKNAMRFEVLPGRSGIELALRAFGAGLYCEQDAGII